MARSERSPQELPASAYPHYHRVLHPVGGEPPSGLLFDSPHFTMMSISHSADSQTPDLNADNDGDRILVLVAGDLVLQIGESRFRLSPGDALKIPRGVRFGNSRSHSGARLLLIRAKPVRSFSLLR